MTDPASSAVIEILLGQLSRDGTTILLTSHILSVVQKLATRVVILHQGRVKSDFNPSTTDEGVEEVYFSIVGEPQPEVLDWHLGLSRNWPFGQCRMETYTLSSSEDGDRRYIRVGAGAMKVHVLFCPIFVHRMSFNCLRQLPIIRSGTTHGCTQCPPLTWLFS